MQASTAPVTFLFTDIEGSTRLWENVPEQMRAALARHDALGQEAVLRHSGRVVKMTGDGIHAVFDDPLDAIAAALELQQALADPSATAGVELRVRCGLHAGVDEHRGNDFYGPAVNRAARIMNSAHGGQILVSEAVAVLGRDRLPAGIALRDIGSVRLRDLAHPERIFQVVHPSLREGFPALRSLEATPNNLPQQVTSFIGRERELNEIERLIAKTRLLTLVGPGGIGKTRLSLQVAANLLDDFPDGVWLVELAALTDARLVSQAVASVLGVKEEAGRPVIEALVKFVSDRCLLVILDNCEHVVQACAEVASRLLHAGPHVKILASSREPLHVGGETISALPPLAVPDSYLSFKRQTLEEYAAARLFIERASAAQPAFQISDGNAMAVARICQRLDGIPLALELAAARVRTLSVEQIGARLSDRFRLLTGGDRTALPRQQTLRALIDWSYDLLTDHERMLLRRLAVFTGGFTLEAAEAVGAGGNVDGKDVLSLLTQLVEKSLVVLDPDGERYRLLETVRHYAHERLSDSDEAAETRTRHVAFFVVLAEKARPEIVGPRQAQWLALLDAERENLLSAHAWCDHAEAGTESGLRLLNAMKTYWYTRGLLALGYRLTTEALARPGAQLCSLARCQGLFDAGQFCSFMGRYSEAQPYLEECLGIAREIGDRDRGARVLQLLGMALLAQRDLASARRYFDECLDFARSRDNKRELAAALNARGQLYRVEGDLDAADVLFEEMLALAREAGEGEIVAIGLLNLAMSAISKGDTGAARVLLRDAVAIADEIGSRPAGQSVVEVCAGLAVTRAQWDRAARFYGAAETLVGQTGIHRDPADDAFLAPLVEKARDALGAEAFLAPEAAGRTLSYESAVAEARTWLENWR